MRVGLSVHLQHQLTKLASGQRNQGALYTLKWVRPKKQPRRFVLAELFPVSVSMPTQIPLKTETGLLQHRGFTTAIFLSFSQINQMETHERREQQNFTLIPWA